MKVSVFIKLVMLGFLVSSTGFALEDSQWAFCSNGAAYRDAGLTQRIPANDWVCSLLTASDTNEPAMDQNKLRCTNGQATACAVGAGGIEVIPGGHNVPRAAWYAVAAAKTLDQYPATDPRRYLIRCECGCLPYEEEILTSTGYQQIGFLSKNATALNLRVVLAQEEDKESKLSSPLRKKDFTVGPEEKEIYIIRTASGKVIRLTSEHPVPVKAPSGEIVMKRAQELTTDSVLVAENGDPIALEDIRLSKLPKANNMVYNVDTNGKGPQDHIIIASGIQIGDLYWQKKLSERKNRVNALYNLSK